MDILQNPVFWIVVTAASEIIGMNPKWKHNSVLQVAMSLLMKLKPASIKK
jgi:hypothetical protein